MKAKTPKRASDVFADKLGKVHNKATRSSGGDSNQKLLQKTQRNQEIAESLDKLFREGRFRTIYR